MTQSATRKARTQLHKRRVSTSDAEGTKRKPPKSEKDLLSILIRNVVNATALENRAREEFNAAMNRFPCGLPYPDGAQEISVASARLSSARNMLAAARNRLDDVMNKRSVPEDLKRSA
jgi:hypothetical protein